MVNSSSHSLELVVLFLELGTKGSLVNGESVDPVLLVGDSFVELGNCFGVGCAGFVSVSNVGVLGDDCGVEVEAVLSAAGEVLFGCVEYGIGVIDSFN